MYPLLTNINSQFIDSCGKPLAGGKVYTYEANTTTPKTTYADSEGLAVNTNPIILDESGRARIYMGDGSYRIRVLDRNEALIADTNKISRYVTNTELEVFVQTVEAGLSDLSQVKESLEVFVTAELNAQKGAAGGIAPLDSDAKVDLDYLPKWIKVAMYTPIPYPKAIPPEGFLMMMGQAIDQPVYPNLYALYGSVLPDMRAAFIRGWDNGLGIDTGRALLSLQLDEFKSHNHNRNPLGEAETIISSVGDFAGDLQGSALKSKSFTVTGDKGGTETRPRNIAFNYIVLAG